MSSSSPESATTFVAPGSSVDPFGLASPLASESPRQHPSHPLRRSSPRLFRDFFLDAMADTAARRRATLPPPVPTHHDPLHNVNRALENANRALQDAQEAFHHARRLRAESDARRLRTDSEAPNQLVDLTRTSSPAPPEIDRSDSAESHYISHTTHPHDSSQSHRSRRLNTLDEPVYGNPAQTIRLGHDLPPLHAVLAQPASVWSRAPTSQSTQRAIRTFRPRIPFSRQFLPSTAEEEAINRQRENHSNWERTQARNRERQLHQELDRSRTTDMSPPSSASSRPAAQPSQRRSRTSHPDTDPDDSEESSSIDEVDLTAVNDQKTLTAVLEKQREEAILSQNPGTDAGRTPLTAYQCPVCMETPTDATSTICGHVFCHKCIVETLRWSIDQRREDAPGRGKVKGVCPVCRKLLDLKDTPGNGRSLVPLELKLLVKKRKRGEGSSTGKTKDKGKGKSLVKAETLSDDEDEATNPTKRERESTEDEIFRAFVEDDDEGF